MDKIIEEDRNIIRDIAILDLDTPVLMINQNIYKKGEYPGCELYKKWRQINKIMIDSVGGKPYGVFLLMGIKKFSMKSSHIGTRLTQYFLISSTTQIVLKLRN
jgi:hypothetical protein